MELKYVPKALENDATKKDLIYDFGTLNTYKKFMVENKDFKGRYNHSMSTGDWSGVKTYDKYLELLENGDEAVMKKIKLETTKQIAELGKKYVEVIDNYKFDVTGQFFDVGLVMTGVPETWLEPEIKEEEQVQVEIVVNGSFPDGSDLDIVVENAGRVLAMVKILEDHGVEVKIIQVATAKNFRKTGETLFAMVNIKDYDEPINYKKCSALMSPTYLRRGCMKMMEVFGGNTLSSGYGKSLNMEGAVRLLDTKQVDALERKLFKGGKK